MSWGTDLNDAQMDWGEATSGTYLGGDRPGTEHEPRGIVAPSRGTPRFRGLTKRRKSAIIVSSRRRTRHDEKTRK